MKKYFYVFLIILTLRASVCFADTITQKGQVSSWLTYGNNTKQFGLLFIPEAQYTRVLNPQSNLDVNASISAYGFSFIDKLEEAQKNSKAKLYRGWARYSTHQFEARAGLQKISFGPAKILRSLMWFDKVDPRDPLQLTDGVNAALARYCFKNNANIWAWGLYGNKGLQGLETYETNKRRLEAGGRWQFPVPRGEAAFTYNNRYIDPADWAKKMTATLTNGLETRYAFDANFDIDIGAWIEAVAEKSQINPGYSFWNQYLTIGADYTLDISNGVHILAEHFTKATGMSYYGQTNRAQYSAFMTDFNVNTLDSFKGIIYYDWIAKKAYPFAALARTYDNWQINLSIFNSSISTTGEYLGKGAQIVVIYNY